MKQNDIFLEAYTKLNPKQKEAVDTTDGPVMVVAWPGTGKTQIIAARAANIILKSGVNPENIFITTFTEAWVVAIKERLLKFIGKESYKVYVSTIHSFAQDVIASFPEKFSEEKSSQAIDEIDSLQIFKEIIQKLIDVGDIEELRANGQDMFYLRDIKRTVDKLKQEAVTPWKFKALIEKQAQIYAQKLEDLKTNKRIRDLEKRTQKDKGEFDAHIQKLNELYLIYLQYQKFLRDSELYDFNDMINFVVEKFRVDEDMRYHYAEKFQYIMLDEYQDTNNAQNEIVSLIVWVTQDAPNIMVVGDDDQSIYRFQGANIENMLDFHHSYPEVKIIVLEDNYRSKQSILDCASALISNNQERLVGKIPNLEKKLISQALMHASRLPEGEEFHKREKPIFTLAPTQMAEKMYVLEEIQKCIAKWISPHEIAIIPRSNREIQDWTEFLKSNGFEVDSKMKTNILNSPYIHFLLDFLALVLDPYNNDEKFINILRTQIVDVENIDIIKMNRFLYSENYTTKKKMKLFDLLSHGNKLSGLELKDITKVIAFRDTILKLNGDIRHYSFLQFFDVCIKEIGIIEYVEKNGTFEDLQDIYTLFNAIKDFWKFKKNLDAKKFLEKIDLYKDYNYPIERQVLLPSVAGIQIMTAHGSKGLEYEAVFIPWLYLGNWDDKKVVEKIKLPAGIVGDGVQEVDKEDIKEKQKEEDRRLFFVALTRAKQYLYLSSPLAIDGKVKILSEFVEEIRPFVDFQEGAKIDESALAKTVKNMLLTQELFSHSDDEIRYIEEFLKTYRLSASDLNVFLEDPLSFLHRVVYKYPFEGNEATIFWSVYHSSLEYFYKDYKKTGVWWTKDQLIEKFSHLLKREMLTPLELERLEKKWREGLLGYYDYYKNSFQEPFFVEYNFRGKDVFFEEVPLTGKIDKIIRVWGGEAGLFQKEEVGIVDYKTWGIKYVWELKGVDRNGVKDEGFTRWKYFRQLLFYRLLCEQASEFSKHYEVKKLFIDFVEGREWKYKIEDIEFSDDEYTDFKNLLKESWEKIRSIEFWKELVKG